MHVPSRNRIALIAATLLAAALLPVLAAAQDDPNDAPLGDVARSLRKKTPDSQEVIDNDNLTQVMDQVQSHRLSGASLLYSIDGGGNSFRVSVPDVSCSLSFSANAKALLSSQYVQLDLPETELPKLEGPATIAGDSLQVSVYNGTDWHVSEVDVAVTVIKPSDPAPSSSSPNDGTAMAVLSGEGRPAASGETGPQKRSDSTFLYKMRAASPPSSVTVFSAPLNVDIQPGQEWHWAIVQAKGYPPQRPLLPIAQSTPPAQEPLPLSGAPLSDAQADGQGSEGMTSPPSPLPSTANNASH